MKQIILLSLSLLIAVTVMSQTQQGVVKTRGRMINGVLQPGKGLAGATVQVAGRQAVVSKGTGGNFSFPVTGQKYRVQNVQKQGYQLVDYSVCTEYKYSENPLRLVMETPEQQQSDLLAAERKIRRNLQRQLQQREDEIEALKVSQQEKDSLLRVLYQQQGDNEKLIADMAKRYSTLDYDQLDEYYQQVSSFIENGELSRADSLLRCKGDVNAQVNVQLQREQTINEQKEQLQKAEAVLYAEKEELARRCYSFFLTFFAQHQNDSAAYYLQLRTKLDSTNTKWLNDLGFFVYEYLGKAGASYYIFEKEWEQSVASYGEMSDNAIKAYINMLSVKMDNFGSYYKYRKGLKTHNLFASMKEELTDEMNYIFNVCEQVYGKNSSLLAIAYNNFGSIMLNNSLIDEANALFRNAIDICNMEVHSKDITTVSVLNNIASVCYENGDYTNAYNRLKEAISKGEMILDNNHPLMANLYNNLANVLYKEEKYEDALNQHKRVLEIRKKIYNRSHPLITDSYNNLGVVYVKLRKYTPAMDYFNKALSIYSKIEDEDEYYKAITYNNIGLLHIEKKEYNEAILSIEKALRLIHATSTRDVKATAIFNNNIGIAYYELSMYDKSEKAFERTFELFESLQNKQKTLTLKSNIVSILYLKKEFNNALRLLKSNNNTDNPLVDGIYGLNGNYSKMLDHFYDVIKDKIVERGHRPRLGSSESDRETKVITINHIIENNEELVLDISRTEDYYLKLIKEWGKDDCIEDSLLSFAYTSIADYYLFCKENETNAMTYYLKAKEMIKNWNNLLLAKIYLCLAILNESEQVFLAYYEYALRILEFQLGTNNALVNKYKNLLPRKATVIRRLPGRRTPLYQ